MNGTSNDYPMQDPYAQSDHSPWGAAGNDPSGMLPSPVYTQSAPPRMAEHPSHRTPPQPPTMHHGLSTEVIGSPISVEEAYQGSLRGMLSREIGAYIAATFLMGNGELVRWPGRLYEVGNNYVVIYQEEQQRYVVGDLNSLRFVEFSETGGCSPITAHPDGNSPVAW